MRIWLPNHCRHRLVPCVKQVIRGPIIVPKLPTNCSTTTLSWRRYIKGGIVIAVMWDVRVAVAINVSVLLCLNRPPCRSRWMENQHVVTNAKIVNANRHGRRFSANERRRRYRNNLTFLRRRHGDGVRHVIVASVRLAGSCLDPDKTVHGSAVGHVWVRRLRQRPTVIGLRPMSSGSNILIGPCLDRIVVTVADY